MTVLEIEAKKAELARSILNIDSEELLNELLKFYEKLTVKMPCMYSVEEIHKSVNQAIADFNSGDMSKFIPHEEVEKRHIP